MIYQSARWLVVLILLVGCQQDKRYFVVSKIKNAAKLAITETTIDKVVVGTQDKRLMGIIKVNQARFVARTQAYVKAGVDLNKLQAADIEIIEQAITLRLPAVEVINFSYPFAEFEVDRSLTKNAFLNKMDILDYEKFYQEAELDIRNNLQFMGIREATERRIRLLMESLLKNLGYQEIHILFKEGNFIEEVNPNAGEE